MKAECQLVKVLKGGTEQPQEVKVGCTVSKNINGIGCLLEKLVGTHTVDRMRWGDGTGRLLQLRVKRVGKGGSGSGGGEGARLRGRVGGVSRRRAGGGDDDGRAAASAGGSSGGGHDGRMGGRDVDGVAQGEGDDDLKGQDEEDGGSEHEGEGDEREMGAEGKEVEEEEEEGRQVGERRAAGSSEGGERRGGALGSTEWFRLVSAAVIASNQEVLYHISYSISHRCTLKNSWFPLTDMV